MESQGKVIVMTKGSTTLKFDKRIKFGNGYLCAMEMAHSEGIASTEVMDSGQTKARPDRKNFGHVGTVDTANKTRETWKTANRLSVTSSLSLSIHT